MKEQQWYCKECNEIGYVSYDKNDGPITIADKIKVDHRKTSPACPHPIENIQAPPENPEH